VSEKRTFSVAVRIWVFLILLQCLTGSAQTPMGPDSMEAMIQAIDDNDTNALKAIHARNTNCVDDAYYAYYQWGRYPLLQAAADGHGAMVALLLEYGASPNVVGVTRDSMGNQTTPLSEAVSKGHLEICELLLKAGADPNQRAPFHNVFKRYSYYSDSTFRDAAASLLLDYGANPFLEAGDYNNTPVDLDIALGNGKMVARMLGQDESNPLGNKSARKSASEKDPQSLKATREFLREHGAALLTAAAQRGELEAVRALLQAGVKASGVERQGAPILHVFALAAGDAATKRLSALDALRQTRKEISDLRPDMSPQVLAFLRTQEAQQVAQLELLAPERWREILDLLVKSGADYDAFAATALGDLQRARRLLGSDQGVLQARDRSGQTPLHWSVQTDQLPLISFWIEAGVSTAATNISGQTALHLAAAKGLVEPMKVLLAARAPTSARDTNGLTPLDAAIQAKQQAAIRLLLSDRSAGPRPERAVATALHDAAANGDLAALSRLTEPAAKLEAPDELGLTSFQLAVQHGHLAAAALLVNKGADVNARDPDGNTTLHLILLLDHWFTVQDCPPTNWLAQLGSEPRKATYLKYLAVGSYEEHPSPVLQAVSFLLACGLDAKATNHAGQSAVRLVTDEELSHKLSLSNLDRPQLLELLASGGGDLNEADAHGNTALHRNAVGYNEIFGTIIASGADVNATNHDGRTPLHLAVEKISWWPSEGGSQTNPVLALLQAKANVNARDNAGLTPLHMLAAADTSFSVQCTRALLDAGADPKIRDKRGRTPIHSLLAGKKTWYEADSCLQMLRDAGVQLSARDDTGKTALHYLAALGGQSPMFHMPEIGDFFVAAKVDIQARDDEGDTPLHIAARTGTGDVFEWLLSRGAKLDETNHHGETPRLLAVHSKHPLNSFKYHPETDIFDAAQRGKAEAVEALLKADSSLLYQTNEFGETLLWRATVMHRTNVIDLLDRHGARWDAASAVLAGRADKLRAVLAADPSAANSTIYGQGLLHLAAGRGDVDIASILLDYRCSLTAPDARGLSPLG
jgi:ankyrin repeat protein